MEVIDIQQTNDRKLANINLTFKNSCAECGNSDICKYKDDYEGMKADLIMRDFYVPEIAELYISCSKYKSGAEIIKPSKTKIG